MSRNPSPLADSPTPPLSDSVPPPPTRRAISNRANAQHSTGPRTPAGKRASAQNASTHYAYCADLLQPGEPEPFFHAHREAIIERLCPMDAVELCLAERVVSAAWRLRRLQAADHCLALMEETDLREQAKDQRRRLHELRCKAAELNVTVDGDDDQNGDDCPGLPSQPLNPGLLIAHALRPRLGDPPYHNSRTNSPFERLLAAEQRLQGMLHRALKELRQLQSQRRDHPHEDETCPFLTPDEDEDSSPAPNPPSSAPHPATRSVQNEATCHNDSPTQSPAEPQKTEQQQLTTNHGQLTTNKETCKLPPVARSTIDNAP